MRKDEDPIIVEKLYKVSKETLWSAITELPKMKKWYFEDIPEFSPEVGFETSFPVVSAERTFTHQWKIIESIPNQMIKYTWSYPEYPGDSTVCFEIISEGQFSKLRLCCEILEDFPDDIPEFKRESCLAGWNYFLGDRLKSFLT